jgi:hypothetical protein
MHQNQNFKTFSFGFDSFGFESFGFGFQNFEEKPN